MHKIHHLKYFLNLTMFLFLFVQVQGQEKVQVRIVLHAAGLQSIDTVYITRNYAQQSLVAEARSH